MDVHPDIDREDQALLRTLIYIWTGIFALGAALYTGVVLVCWPV